MLVSCLGEDGIPSSDEGVVSFVVGVSVSALGGVGEVGEWSVSGWGGCAMASGGGAVVLSAADVVGFRVPSATGALDLTDCKR